MTQGNTLILQVQLSTWMKPLTPSNDARTHYRIGEVINWDDTDCIVLAEANYPRRLLCTKHNFVYELGGQCVPCQSVGSDVANQAGVTARNTL